MKHLQNLVSGMVLVASAFVATDFATAAKPFAVVSVDKLEKFVYRGIPNPITIQVPNAKSVKVSCEGLKKIDEFGHYTFNPGAGTRATVKIEAIMNSGLKYKDSVILRIGNIPSRRNYFAGVTSYYGEIPKLGYDTFDNGKLTIERDYRYEETFKIDGFMVKVPGMAALEMRSDSLSQEAMKSIRKLKRGNQVTIYDIKGKSSLSTMILCDKSHPILLEIK